MSAESYIDSRLISFTTSGNFSVSATLASAAATSTPYDLITFLGIAQGLNIDFLPITWDVGQASIGQGGTAEISQSSVNVETAFAFKRLSSVNSDLSEEQQTAIFKALIAEVIVLGHKSIRAHGNINRLEGICWDVEAESDRVWPVFVFEKTQHGDLKTFMEHGAGTRLDLWSRLRLCAEIATAVLDLHLSGIIHGDIKPANVLVFATDSKHYTARVADFGYSTWLGGTDDAVLMPRTPHWTAPEWHHRPMHSSSAIRMDVYSFGLLCLWLLFYNGGETEGHDFYKDLESKETASTLARRLVDELNVTDDDDVVKRDLYRLFNMSLAIDPADRCSDLDQLVCLLTRDRVPNSYNVELIENNPQILTHEFRLSSSIYPLYRSDHRVRTYIAACLENRVVPHSAPALTSPRAAFELSFCYTLGFGVKKDNIKASALLKQAGRSQGELTYEIDRVRYGRSKPPPRQGIYNASAYRGHNIRRSTIGYRYNLEQGNLDQAASRLRTELADVESSVGVDHQISGFLKSTLVTVLIGQKKWEEAQVLETQNLQQISETLGERHPDTLSTRSGLAFIYANQRKWKEAELLQTQAVTASLSEVGLDAPVTLTSMSNLATIFRDQGKLEKAERLGKQVLEIRMNALGPENPDTKNSSEFLASFKLERDFWKRWETETLQRERFGTDMTLPTVSMMLPVGSEADWARDRPQRIEYFLQMLRIKEGVYGREHPLILTTLMTLAHMYQKQGQWKEAEEIATEVVGIRKRKNLEHPSTVTDMLRLGSIYASQGRWKDAEEIQLQTVELSSKIEKNESARLLVLSHLASTYSSQGRLNEAAKLQVQIMEANIREFGREDIITLNSMGNLSSTYTRQGQWEDAEVLALHVVKSRQISLGPENPSTLAGMANLVKVYKGQERWDEAERLAISVVDKKKEVSGVSHPRTIRSMRDLAEIWHGQRRFQEAFDLMSKVVGLSETAVGFDHPDTIGRMKILDNWVSEAILHPQAGDDERARPVPNSNDTGTMVPESLTQIPQAVTGSAQIVDRAAKSKTYSGIQKSSSRRREKLDAYEKQISRIESDKQWRPIDRRARQISDLLIEYGIDWTY